MALYLATTSFKSSALKSVSNLAFLSCFTDSSMCSNSSWSTSKTTLPSICIKRRYESHANLSLPVFSVSPTTDSSLSPRFRIVSIIPGIDATAPDLTETNKGFFASPNFLPIFFSRLTRLFFI